MGAASYIPLGPLLASNPRAKPFVTSAMPIGTSNAVDGVVINALDDVRKTLYGAVAELRTHRAADDDARFHLLVPLLAIAAAETDAVVTLVSSGIQRPADVHVRTLGQCARYAYILEQPEQALLCTQLRDSLSASRKEHSKRLERTEDQRDLSSELYSGVDGDSFKSLEKLISNALKNDEKQSTRPRPALLTAAESIGLSKWAHADVLALHDAARGIKTDTTDLRNSLGDPTRTFMRLSRAFQFGLTLIRVAEKLGADVAEGRARANSHSGEILAKVDLIAQQVYADGGEVLRRLRKGKTPEKIDPDLIC
jgi:hypothetical protein